MRCDFRRAGIKRARERLTEVDDALVAAQVDSVFNVLSEDDRTLTAEALSVTQAEVCALQEVRKAPCLSAAAWADRITFEEIEKKTGKKESDVIKIMRRSLKPSSFRLWRKRVNQKSIKHRKKFEYSRKEITSKIKKGDYL